MYSYICKSQHKHMKTNHILHNLNNIIITNWKNLEDVFALCTYTKQHQPLFIESQLLIRIIDPQESSTLSLLRIYIQIYILFYFWWVNTISHENLRNILTSCALRWLPKLTFNGFALDRTNAISLYFRWSPFHLSGVVLHSLMV